jgi:glycosyltransferase involved in cell wall biosynthesis
MSTRFSRVYVIPNGVDTGQKQPDSSVQPRPNSLIYTGAVTYQPNYDAVVYFVREVLPLVRQRYPDIIFTVTGGTGDIDVSDLAAQPGVRFSGYLPEIDPAIRESWLTVVPLRMGGGTRLKILESMALGTPIVSTHKGAEGLNVSDGENIVLADSPAAMAEAIAALLADPARRDALAQAGRALVEAEYDWAIISARLSAIAERIVNKVVVNAQ